MEFTTPRFQGDQTLHEILNDPDTGTKKLKKHSPAPAVRRVQQALYDMGWSLRVVPPIADEAVFVDGDYGPATTGVVLAYKTHHDIHFPPDAPTGTIDGFTGPRTLMKLDAQLPDFDESVAAIDAKAADLRFAGVAVALAGPPPLANVIFGTRGVFRDAEIDGATGAIFHERTVGAFEVHGPIWDAYFAQGHAAGPLGFPTSDEHDDDEPGFRRSDFQNGAMRLDTETGTVEELGPE